MLLILLLILQGTSCSRLLLHISYNLFPLSNKIMYINKLCEISTMFDEDEIGVLFILVASVRCQSPLTMSVVVTTIPRGTQRSILCLFHLVSSMLDLDHFDPYIKSVCSGVITLKDVCHTLFTIEENPRVYLKFVSSGITNVGSRPFSMG